MKGKITLTEVVTGYEVDCGIEGCGGSAKGKETSETGVQQVLSEAGWVRRVKGKIWLCPLCSKLPEVKAKKKTTKKKTTKKKTNK